MSNFFKKFAVFLVIIAAISGTFAIISPNFASADTRLTGEACPNFGGLVSWDCGFNGDSIGSEQELANKIAIIASNILTDAAIIASYLVIGYVIYGGYLYMSSSGDPVKATTGKKTLTHAFLGLTIVISAYIIFGAIRVALIGGNSFGECSPIPTGGTGSCVDPGAMVTNIIQWVCGVSGAVAVIFVILGAWGYITAAGSPEKLQKSKNTILFSIIGLVIIAAALVITNLVSSIVRGAANGEDAYVPSADSTALIININKETPNEKV